MTALILDGKAIAEDIRAQVAREVEALVSGRPAAPRLATVLGGTTRPPTPTRGKRKACAEVGIDLRPLPPRPARKRWRPSWRN
jgi:methylenetetrahydrofolate dehydrogenase (NADP+)/methenyltetrahydrofolate cyclohydrolase